MATPQSHRRYDLVVFGATGYTGKLTCEQLLLRAPTNLHWAIAGRSLRKLEILAADFNARFPDRRPVATFISDLSEDALDKLAKCTRCLITTVGPYIKYGTAVVGACAKNGTHYVDSTGEIPWVKRMVDQYHETALETGAIMIPQCGVESAPADLATYKVVNFVRERLGCPVADLTFALHELKSGISGGTLETTLSIFEHCTLQEILVSAKPYSMSPVVGRPIPTPPPITRHPDLGILTSWIQAIPDRTIVMRSWGLLDGGGYYGPNFVFREYRKTANWVTAVAWLALISVISVLPLIAPLRWIARKVLTQPGDGPSVEAMARNRAEWQGVAVADDGKAVHTKARVVFRYEGDCYTLTGILLAQTALAILEGGKTAAARMGGGVLTPSMVASEGYFDALEKAGVVCKVGMLA